MKKAFLLFAAILAAPALHPEPGPVSIRLSDVEEKALAHSPQFQAAEHETTAAHNRALAQKSRLWPALSVEGTWKYLTEVPRLPAAISGGRSLTLGDNENYSIGPQAVWTLWDSGLVRRQWQGLEAQARSQEENAKWVRRRVLLSARLAYFQLRLALEQVRLLSDSLELARAQYRDIEDRRRGGVSSRIDSLSAHEEMLGRRRQFQEARTELALALRELAALTGESPAEGLVPSTSAVQVAETPDGLKARLEAQITSAPDENHPDIRAFAEMARALHLSARSALSGHGPKVQISARTSFDRPNGPLIETFNQNTVGVSLMLPLFEGGRVNEQAAEWKEQALGAEEKKREAEENLLRDWRKARDRIAGLEEQQRINEESIRETEELARLVYESYRAGTSNYIDVQAANVRALEAKVLSARTEVQILIQMSILASLSGAN